MEISKLNSLYNSLILYIARCVYGAELGLEFSLLINTKLYYYKRKYIQLNEREICDTMKIRDTEIKKYNLQSYKKTFDCSLINI